MELMGIILDALVAVALFYFMIRSHRLEKKLKEYE